MKAIFALLVLLGLALCDPPGLKFYINQGGIGEIQQIVNPMIMSLSEGVVIPDVHLSAVGIHLDLTHLQLHTFKFTDEAVQLQEPCLQIAGHIFRNKPSLQGTLTS